MLSHFLGFQTVRKIAAVSLMPALLIAVICHFDKSLYELCLQYSHD
jgi:hypothetical protein